MACRIGFLDASDEFEIVLVKHKQFVIDWCMDTLSFKRHGFVSVRFDFRADVVQLNLDRVESRQAFLFFLSIRHPDDIPIIRLGMFPLRHRIIRYAFLPDAKL